jgi:hypothetical protein
LPFPFFINALADLYHSCPSQRYAPSIPHCSIESRHAWLSAACHGALVVNYMHHCYSYVYPDHDPSQLETRYHVSLITNMITSYHSLHWCGVDPVDGEVYYRPEPTEWARLHRSRDEPETRRILHNHIYYEMRERLKSIKTALPRFGRTGR